jgi:hypothetical protein
MRICTIIDQWPLPSITWEILVKEVGTKIGQAFSRQALERNKAIKAAYLVRKGLKPELARMSEAEQTIQRLRQRNEELEELVRRYDLRFLRHAENARLLGIKARDLDRPLDGESND